MAEQISAAGRAGLRRRHQGRPVRHRLARRSRARSCWLAPPKIGQDWQPQACPTEFFALGGHGIGIPLRATMSSLRPDAAVQGARPQRDPGVVARPGLPLRRHAGPAAARPDRPARGAAAPDQRRGQGRAEGDRRAQRGHRRGDPARPDHLRRPGRRGVLRRAGVRHRRPAPRHQPTARASSRCSSCRTCRTGRRCSPPS